MKNKKKRFVPTEESLEISQQLANKLGFEFHTDKVKHLALNLHRTYFNEIIGLLQLGHAGIDFDPGSIGQITAFIDPVAENKGMVFFDEQFDFWLSELVTINTIAACKLPPEKDFMKMVAIFEKTLKTFVIPDLHKQTRAAIKPFIFEHSDVVPLAHELSKAMMVFIICHEIAHKKLGHLGKTKSRIHEFEADLRALTYFEKIIALKKEANYIKLEESFLAAPILLMNYLSILERYLYKKFSIIPSRESHPAPIIRAKKMYEHTNTSRHPKAHEYLEGFLMGLKDIVEELHLPVIKERY
ncbi:hypothetical protein ACJD0Z_03365 [Flavobacteriaceae bacterium M23B6Z8]